MKLSELKTGQRGVIVKVSGHGGFRKRIVEMGFIRGKEVEVLLNAPLQDPVKYRIMGYEVSLRHQEADMIEVVGGEALKSTPMKKNNEKLADATPSVGNRSEAGASSPPPTPRRARLRKPTLHSKARLCVSAAA